MNSIASSQFKRPASRDVPKPFLLRILSGILPAFLVGCGAVPMAPGDAHADETTRLQRIQLADERSQLMYEIMIAELAGRRGYLDVATEGYLRASSKTDDARVAERATKLAVWGRLWGQAEEGARRWLDLDPDSVEARELLAQVLMRSENPEGAALDEFANLVENAEDPGGTLREIFLLLSREQDRPAALATLRGLQSRFPDEPEAHLGVARMLLQMNDRDAALVAAERAVDAGPEHGEALLLRAQVLSSMGKPAQGLDQIKQALETDADNINLRLGYAQLLAELGRYKDAGVELEYLYQNHGDNADVLLSIGLMALDSKRTEAAERYFNALRDTGDHRNQANYYLARIHDQKQNIDEAIKRYEQVGEGELYLSAQLRSAELHAVSGQLEVGIEKVRALNNRLPDPAMQPLLITAESRLLHNAGRDNDAVGVLTQGLEKFPGNGELLYARALAADRVGDNDTLINDLTKLIEDEPNNANALNALGYFLADENIRLDEAEQYIEKALQLKPNEAPIMDSLGWLRFRQGNYEAAIALLERAYELLPDGEIAAHLGEVHWVMGNQQIARTIWEKALLQSPDHEKLVSTVERLTQ
jgi:tetratricopeptide (TPR) repeat protein